MNLRLLREQLQAPRRPYDTLYGRWVMRRLSIYITSACVALRVRPALVTTLSLAAGLWGVYCILQTDWLGGLLWVNAWYLLDHVDGELARYYKCASPAGLFFDTILNAIVTPLTFFSLGASLWTATDSAEWLIAGAIASYGALMLLVIPYCEAAVILQSRGVSSPQAMVESSQNKKVSQKSGGVGRVFGVMNSLVTFPVFLPLTTLLVVILILVSPLSMVRALQWVLLSYACLVSVVWTTILFHSVLVSKTDRLVAGPR